jgi:hypothetical protein
LDYLDELGITYLHLMPLLEPRAGENDVPRTRPRWAGTGGTTATSSTRTSRGGSPARTTGGCTGRSWTGRPRRHPRSGTFIGLANFAEEPQSIEATAIGHYGWLETALSSDGPLEVREGRAYLPALGFVWLVER